MLNNKFKIMYFLLIFLPAVSYAGYYTPLSSIDIKNETNTSMKITVDVHGTRFNCITLENNSIKDDPPFPATGIFTQMLNYRTAITANNHHS